MNSDKKTTMIGKVKNLEGYKIVFLGDEEMATRQGIITDIFPTHKKQTIQAKEVNVVILWDTDEHIRYENGRKVITFDLGVSVYPLPDILDMTRFNILTNR